MLSRHSEALRPPAVGEEAPPGYGTESLEELRSEGTRWTGDPEGMKTEAEGAIQGGDPATSDAPEFSKAKLRAAPRGHHRPPKRIPRSQAQGTRSRAPCPRARKRRCAPSTQKAS